MTPSEIYQLAYQHNQRISVWYDTLVQDALDTLIRQGFYDPKCYALSYSFELDEYATTVIAIDPDSLTDAKKNERKRPFSGPTVSKPFRSSRNAKKLWVRSCASSGVLAWRRTKP